VRKNSYLELFVDGCEYSIRPEMLKKKTVEPEVSLAYLHLDASSFTGSERCFWEKP